MLRPALPMLRPALIVSATALLLAAPAVAQDASQEVGTPLMASPLAQAEVAQLPPGVLPRADQLVWHGEELLGRDIRNPAGETLGSVEDFVIDPQTGRTHVLVDVGGVLGVGSQRVAVALSEMLVDGEGVLVLDSTEDQLAARHPYRFPDSPMTGAIRPGHELPQTAAGIGDPGQGPQFLPDATTGDWDAAQGIPHQQPVTRDNGSRIHDDPLAQAIRGEGTPLIDADPNDREASLKAAAESMERLRAAVDQADLDDNTQRILNDLHAEATERYRAAAEASPEAWPTTLHNLNVVLGRLYQQTEVAVAEGRNGAPESPATAAPGQASPNVTD